MASGSNEHSSLFLVLIGITKLIKAALLIFVGIGLGRLLQGGAEETLHRWVHEIRIDPENQYIHRAIAMVTGLSIHAMRELRLGTFAYAGLVSAEGVGLVLRKRWAEYLTVIATTGFLPLEIYELFHHLTTVKMVVFILNVVIVAYLVYQLYRTRPHRVSGERPAAQGVEPVLNPPLAEID